MLKFTIYTLSMIILCSSLEAKWVVEGAPTVAHLTVDSGHQKISSPAAGLAVGAGYVWDCGWNLIADFEAVGTTSQFKEFTQPVFASEVVLTLKSAALLPISSRCCAFLSAGLGLDAFICHSSHKINADADGWTKSFVPLFAGLRGQISPQLFVCLIGEWRPTIRAVAHISGYHLLLERGQWYKASLPIIYRYKSWGLLEITPFFDYNRFGNSESVDFRNRPAVLGFSRTYIGVTAKLGFIF